MLIAFSISDIFLKGHSMSLKIVEIDYEMGTQLELYLFSIMRLLSFSQLVKVS